jgi:hypothetical protein
MLEGLPKKLIQHTIDTFLENQIGLREELQAYARNAYHGYVL